MSEQANLQPRELKQTTIGGQALIEGLLMIGPEKKAMASLLPNGEVLVRELGPGSAQGGFDWPVLRGALRVFRQLRSGVKALMLSAEIQEEAERAAEAQMAADGRGAAQGAEGPAAGGEAHALPLAGAPEAEDPGAAPREGDKGAADWTVFLALLFGIGFGVGLFILLPNLLTSLVVRLSGWPRAGFANTLFYNLFEGALRIAILLFYLWLTAKQKSIGRVWMFHGAEHKTIACYEAGLPLTVENVARFSRFHPRCGTSFLFILVFMSALLFALVGWYGLWLNLLIRLAMIPLLAGLAYEVLRFAGKHAQSTLGRILSAPGLLLQRLTTKEPDAQIIGVAIRAMQAVIPADADADRWS